jgi:hypothetical protein
MRLLLPFLFLVGLLFTSTGTAKQNVADTTFFIKHRGKDFRQEVFIDTSRSSEYYKKLSAFAITEEGLEYYQEVIGALSKAYGLPSHVSLQLPDTRWLPAVYHQGKFYLYAPCDWLFHQPVMIADSAIITWGEAAYPELIRSVVRQRDSYKFITQKPWGDVKGEVPQTLHVIDEKRGIAILQTDGSEEEGNLRLLIAQSRMRDFPIIVNNCFDHKTTEWHPEATDLRKLLN